MFAPSRFLSASDLARLAPVIKAWVKIAAGIIRSALPQVLNFTEGVLA